MSCEDFQALSQQANGRCMLCGNATERLLIDHDHAVGRWAVRGLVCSACNWVMRHVDAGRRKPDEQVRAFLVGAWYIGRQEPPRGRRQGGPKDRNAVGFPADSPWLVGVAEIAVALGVTRQRVAQLSEEPDFPGTVADLKAGRIWLRSDIEEWIERSGRRKR